MARFLVLFFLFFSGIAHAHHSFVGDYDGSKMLTLKGVIAGVRFANPHVFIHLNVPGKGTWKVETESLSKIRGKGLERGHLKDGNTVTVRGWPARNGTQQLGLKSITLPGGRTIAVRGTAR